MCVYIYIDFKIRFTGNKDHFNNKIFIQTPETKQEVPAELDKS